MTTSIKYALSVMSLIICFYSSTFAGGHDLCSKQARKLMSSGLVLDFSTDFQKWYVSKKWYSLPLQEKRHYVNRFKFMNMYCTDDPIMNVTVYDNSSLRPLAEYYDRIIIHGSSEPFLFSSPG